MTLVPADPSLDREEIFNALMASDGNVTKVARELGIDPQRLRAYVRAQPALKAAIDETMEQGVDQAIDVLYEGLRDKASFQNRYYAAKEFIRSEAGRRRGFGREPQTQAALEVKTSRDGGVIAIKWLEPPKEREGDA